MRFYQIILLFSLFVLSFHTSCQKVEEVAGCQLQEDLAGYDLVWSDEFDGSSIDASRWSYDLGDGCDISQDLCGWGNNELEFYTDRTENAFISDGKLVICS